MADARIASLCTHNREAAYILYHVHYLLECGISYFSATIRVADYILFGRGGDFFLGEAEAECASLALLATEYDGAALCDDYLLGHE
jgi:hypothetical protein